MLRTGRIALALALAAGAVGLSACGDEEGGTIPPATADQLLQDIDEIEANVDEGECTSALTDVSQLEGAIFELPKSVGVGTKNDLRDLTDKLRTLVASQCEEAQEAPETPTEPGSGSTGADGSVPSDDDDSADEG